MPAPFWFTLAVDSGPHAPSLHNAAWEGEQNEPQWLQNTEGG